MLAGLPAHPCRLAALLPNCSAWFQLSSALLAFSLSCHLSSCTAICYQTCLLSDTRNMTEQPCRTAQPGFSSLRLCLPFLYLAIKAFLHSSLLSSLLAEWHMQYDWQHCQTAWPDVSSVQLCMHLPCFVICTPLQLAVAMHSGRMTQTMFFCCQIAEPGLRSATALSIVCVYLRLAVQALKQQGMHVQVS